MYYRVFEVLNSIQSHCLALRSTACI